MNKTAPTTRPAIVAGQQFGRLTALASSEFTYLKVACRCQCGTEKDVVGKNLLSGKSKSCGCRVVQRSIERMTTHGKSHTAEHTAWCNAKARCHRPSHPRFADWGGRGIRMCEEWRNSFDAFLRDMGPRPGPGYSLDRIDSSRGYEPGNCRWATSKEQSTNRPSFVNTITFDGETLTITDWAQRVGIGRKSLYDRLAAGWTIEQTLTTPKGGRRVAA